MWQFWVLVIFTATLLLWEIVHAARGNRPNAGCLSRVGSIGVGPAVSFFVGALTLLVVRNQFALGLRPFLSYSSKWVESRNESVYLTRAPGGVWTVDVRNSGSGIGIIRAVSIMVSCDGSPEFSGDYEEVVNYLQSCGLQLNREYAISKISPGGVLAKDGEVRIFELTHGASTKFDTLTVSVEFEGALKDTYSKMIYCIPPQGLPPLPQQQS
nr:hypothetical protein OG546_49140 [Streptomyces antimycoticus]WTB12177.1 hypothetical protein OG546_50390 [Streptomyces antimycoticus]